MLPTRPQDQFLVKEEDIKANFKNGTLEITFPKEENKKLEDKKYIQIEGE